MGVKSETRSPKTEIPQSGTRAENRNGGSPVRLGQPRSIDKTLLWATRPHEVDPAKVSVFGFRASFGFRFSVFGFIWSRHCIGNVEEPENDIPALDAGPTLRSAQRASNCARYSVGDWPSSFLKTRLKCVSDWNPTSNAISLTRRLGFSSRFFAFSMRTRER
jgi:hypothetical protein